MSWGRNDPGFPPSPDPTAEAERYYSRIDGPPEDCGGDCGSCPRCIEEERRAAREEAMDEPMPGEFKRPTIQVDDEELPF